MPDPMLGVSLDSTADDVRTATQGPKWPLGTKWTDPLTGFEYMYCNADTAWLAAGNFLTPTLSDADAPFSLIEAATAGLDIFGITLYAVANEGFGWIMRAGRKALCNIADAVVAGDMLGTTTSAGRLDAITFTTTAATLAQLTAGFKSQRSRRVLALTDGTSGNTATVHIS